MEIRKENKNISSSSSFLTKSIFISRENFNLFIEKDNRQKRFEYNYENNNNNKNDNLEKTFFKIKQNFHKNETYENIFKTRQILKKKLNSIEKLKSTNSKINLFTFKTFNKNSK